MPQIKNKTIIINTATLENKVTFILLVAILLACTITADAQTVDEIIQKNITVNGGLDRWRKVNSMTITGSMNAAGQDMPVRITALNKKGVRFEYSMNGMVGYSLLTDKNGWTLNRFAGQTKPVARSQEDVQQSQDGLDIQGLLVDYKSKGHKVAYIGMDTIEGAECYKLQITLSSGREETEFIDAASYYLIEAVRKIKTNEKETVQVSRFGNYTTLDEGIVVPMLFSIGDLAFSLKTVEINKTIDEHIFQPDEVALKK